MPRPTFITGTDTGVGKTFVGGGICLLARKARLRIGVMKPVETGCKEHRGKLLPADAAFLSTHAEEPEDSLDDICPYRFAPPISPETAAREAGVKIDLGKIRGHFEKIASGKDLVIVEGAGGLLAPISEKETMADMAKALKAQVLVVVGSKLGCINHALLTLSELERRKLSVAGLILNEASRSQNDFSLATNAKDLARHTRAPIFGTLPPAPESPEVIKPFAYRKHFEDHLDTAALLAALQR
ncbi:MAG: dethiobiotin synthase, partial [Bdellovibrionota bacterium]